MFTARYNEHMLQCSPRPVLSVDRPWKSNVELAPNCPRCASSNTKFCYYNNYSLSQPRYFCKGCRRYWTKGGSLRNVPVGGGCRKNRRAKAVRFASNSERASTNRGKDMGGFDGNNPTEPVGASPSGADSLVQTSGANTTASDIDLAVVFAKFLNDQSTSTGLKPEFVGEELPDSKANAGIDISDSVTMDIPAEPCLPPEFPQILAEEKREGQQRAQEFQGNETSACELLNDEVIQDVLWSDDAATTMPSLLWQPMGQLQDFSFFEADDLLKIPANLINDSWNSLDLSGLI